MSFVSRVDHHAGLVNRMADTLGLDLYEKAMRGEMQGSEFRTLVLNCLSCTQVGECEHFLDTHLHGAEKAPSYCRNYDFFSELKD